MIHVVLFEPDIPQNTGNIARTCALTGARLHLIKPFGFVLNSKKVKRSGLDYWDKLDMEIHDCIEDYYSKYDCIDTYIVTTKGEKRYTDVKYKEEVALIFGSETKGLKTEIHDKFKNRRITIPMLKNEGLRSLNLSNSVAIVLYEVIRQNGFL